jgi:hypothetical protein
MLSGSYLKFAANIACVDGDNKEEINGYFDEIVRHYCIKWFTTCPDRGLFYWMITLYSE